MHAKPSDWTSKKQSGAWRANATKRDTGSLDCQPHPPTPSAGGSSRRKTSADRSALSMLTFYINRAGKNLPKTQRERLQRAKIELKRKFWRNQLVSSFRVNAKTRVPE
jgi:hypothetical protein